MSNLVDDEEILDAVSSLPAEEACTALVRLALQRGAPDNVTVVVVRTEAI
jgi:serine/threonine protein phosphatase PrpC